MSVVKMVQSVALLLLDSNGVQVVRDQLKESGTVLDYSEC